jgi:hypothetical protein
LTLQRRALTTKTNQKIRIDNKKVAVKIAIGADQTDDQKLFILLSDNL